MENNNSDKKYYEFVDIEKQKKYYEFTDIKNREKYLVEEKSSFTIPSKDKIDILNIDKQQFTQLYHNRITTILSIPQENEGQELDGIIFSKVIAWPLAIIGFFFAIAAWTAFFTGNYTGGKAGILLSAIIASICSLVPVFLFLSIRKMERYYLKEKFFSCFNVKYSRYTYFQQNYNSGGVYMKPLSKELSNAMEKMAISSVKFNPDESLKIDSNGKTLELLELNARVGSKSLLMVSYFINKNFKGETIIKPIKEASKSAFAQKQEVYLEDPLFNKNFKIFADDQVEARYLLTTAFMERLLNFQKKYTCTASILFNNNISRDSNIFLCIDFGKDFFELPKGKDWIHDSSYFYNICQEIKEIAQILDTLKENLKLDQDIGM